MSIPLISNLSFTKVSTSGTLNDKVPATRINLPIQYFQVIDNVTGNLTLDESSAHKKAILDNQSNTILNPEGSPLTNNNTNTPIDLRGSGNIQSQLKSHTVSVSNTDYTGTTTVTALNDSLVVVDDSHTYDTTVVDVERSAGAGNSFGDGLTTVRNPSTNNNEGWLVNESYYSTAYTSLIGGTSMANANRSDFGMSFTHAFLEDGTPISGALTGPGGPSTFDGRAAPDPSINTTHSIGGNTYRFMKWDDCIVGVNKGNSGVFDFYAFVDVNNGQLVFAMNQGRGAFNQIKNVKVVGPVNGRKIRFTNNLSIPAFLTGGNPFTDVSVNSSATVTATRNSTVGSFEITASITGSNGSGQPYALVSVNDGTGSLNTADYTGTFSVRAF
tara:strand:- start:174 stop:1328 length:1155 start_codon:yes stop_codon:yes gene_type:complete